ncbi:MAG: glycosyltransferase family 39 protein [Planctomycetota bacterium]|nr:glycosyltransferase family 39 protein [Planctomycetota bacterium]
MEPSPIEAPRVSEPPTIGLSYSSPTAEGADRASWWLELIRPGRLRGQYYLLLTAFCAAVFGYVAISGRPLTLHEARLPQCSREMMASGSWLIPTSGGRPWLERPPLPHWIMISVAKLIGQHCDNEWSVRIPPALCGLLVAMMVAAIAARWFGNNMGLAAGLILATMYEFYYYSTLAEDDIFLALVVVAAIACFARMEFFQPVDDSDARLHPMGTRPWPVVAFFILLGLTNLAKGPIVGAAVVLGPVGAYLLWQRDLRKIRRYLWFWGILLAAAIGLSWHLYIQHRFPEYAENLRYDFHDTTEFDNPWYYYAPTLLVVTLPWSPAAVIGLWVAIRAAWQGKSAVFRFLCCWAIVPILVLSLPHRRHHHYLVPSIAPWAILAAIGARAIAQQMFKGTEFTRRRSFGFFVFGIPLSVLLIVLIAMHKVPGPTMVSIGLIALWLVCVWMFYQGLSTKSAGWLLAAILLGVGVMYNWGQTYWPNDTLDDTRFLRDVETFAPRDKLLTINAAVGPLDFFRLQFYLREDAKLLHNLSYLRSQEIQASDVYVVGREYDRGPLQSLGETEMVMASPHSHREKNAGERFALFHLKFADNLVRYAPPAVSPMQAMLRKPGPWCGPLLGETR